jgi:hypothetical protein
MISYSLACSDSFFYGISVLRLLLVCFWSAIRERKELEQNGNRLWSVHGETDGKLVTGIWNATNYG